MKKIIILIGNLSLNDSNQIIKIDQANFNYLDTENKKNDYNIKSRWSKLFN